MLRFVNNCKGKDKKTGHITVPEIERATTTIIKVIQRESFSDEQKDIENGKNLNKKSKLFKLNVFVDGSGLLRVGGRLKNAYVPFDTKHQIIMPKKHMVTSLLIGETHKLALYGGPKLVAGIIRQKF